VITPSEACASWSARTSARLAGWLCANHGNGGSTGAGNITAPAEFNICCNPEAAWAVFNCSVPIRMVSLNVTRRTGFNQPESIVADLMAFYLARQRERHGRHMTYARSCPDAALLEYLHTRVEIELAGAHTRGMTVCARPASVISRGRTANTECPGHGGMGSRSFSLTGVEASGSDERPPRCASRRTAAWHRQQYPAARTRMPAQDRP
jgi:Inosine-uridine preferring nucleoside hydrolase